MSVNAQITTLYKDLSYSQLRSYCETARLGSMAAAARSLEVSHPTVWKQIRALEQLLGTTLVESDGRRSELTESGRLLAELASPMVAEFESLLIRFREACGTAPRSLSVAAPPRSYTDDLLPVIKEFRQLFPDVKLMMRESFESLGNEMLEAGEVDLVIGDSFCCRRPAELISERMYEIEQMVIMQPGHPLTKRKKITPEDLSKYPILNHPDSYPNNEGRAILERVGAFNHPGRGFELILAASIRSCVKQGHGIGLVGRVIANPPKDPNIEERSLKHCLPSSIIYGYSIKRITENPIQRAFIDLVKARLNPQTVSVDT